MPNIPDMVKQIQDEIMKRFGVTANLSINIHNCPSYEVARHIGNEIVHQLGEGNGILTNDSTDYCQWVKIDTAFGFELAAYYPAAKSA